MFAVKSLKALEDDEPSDKVSSFLPQPEMVSTSKIIIHKTIDKFLFILLPSCFVMLFNMKNI